MINVESGLRTAPQIRTGCIRSPLGKECSNWGVGPQNGRVRAHGWTATV